MTPRRFILLSLTLALGIGAAGQRRDFLGNTSLVVQAGGMTYTGDLNNQSLLNIPHAALGLGVRYNLDNRIDLRFGASAGNIASGFDDCEAWRNLHFRSHIYELSAMVEFSFWNFGRGATDKQWAFFVFGGLAAFHYNPQASYLEADGTRVWVDLQPLHTEGQSSALYPDRLPYSHVGVALPFGVGVKMRLNETFILSIEYGLRKTWTDYLDDVSRTYVGADVLHDASSEGSLAARLADRSNEVIEGYVNAPGIKRGDDSLDDMYAFFNISLGIQFETLFGWMRSNRCRN